MKKTINIISLLALTLFVTGCQLPYLAKSAYSQVGLLTQREALEDVLADPKLDKEKKRKLQLALDARRFAEEKLNLKPTDNYTSYVELGRPYVSWIVRVAPRYKLEHHLWDYPVVGALPYKGFFDKKDAEKEAKTFSPEKYDTYVRGVTAYSTLGWFDDPILSSMLRYSDHDLVNVIIHETVHATIFIDGQADFNERLATFLGNKGTELFYKAREGKSSPTLAQIQKEGHDARIFSEFITEEIESLRKWYKQNADVLTPEKKAERLQQIKQRFQSAVHPQLKTKQFDYFTDFQLNNASLLSYETYYVDLSDFEKLLELLDNDFKALLAYCKNLEDSEKPEKDLKTFVQGKLALTNTPKSQ